MRIEYDENALGYVSARERYQLLTKEFEKPSELASVCRKSLDAMDCDVNARLAAVFAAAAAALGLTVSEARQLAIRKLNDEWRSEELARISSLEAQRWYRRRSGGETIIINHIPDSGSESVVEGPISHPNHDTKSLRETLELRATKIKWSDREIAGAFTRPLFKLAFKERKFWPPNEEYALYDQAYIYANHFRREARKIIEYCSSVCYKKALSNSTKTTYENKKPIVRIHFLGKEDDLKRITHELGCMELLDPNEVLMYQTHIAPHFFAISEASNDDGASNPSSKINWLGTITELISFFELLYMNNYINGKEEKHKPSLIQYHFLRNSNEISKSTVSSIIKNTSEDSKKSATKKIERVFRKERT